MERPSFLDYYDHRQFLTDFVNRKKQARPIWSLGIWASQLGLSGTASISRVISGERIPGADLVETLCEYFKFSSEEEKYFKHLVTRERYYHAEVFERTPSLIIKNARNVGLRGVLDTKKVEEFLKPYGLTPLPVQGEVLAAININCYPETSFGPYNECHVAITTQRPEGGLLDFGLFFCGFTVNQENAAQSLHRQYGYEIQQKDISVQRTSERIEARVGSEITFKVAESTEKLKRIEEKYEMCGYFQSNGKIDKQKFMIDTIGREKDFNPQTDCFSLPANDPAYDFLKSLNFQPRKWLLHENMFSVIHTPASFELAGSY